MRGGRLSYGGIDISAGSMHPEYIDVGGMTDQKLDDINKGKWFSIEGFYAYCDEFGAYRCRHLALKYDSTLADFVAGPLMDIDCYNGPSVPPQEPASLRVLKRCQQPDENDQAETYADSNAGKVFPPAYSLPTPAPKPARTPNTGLSKPE